jgi:hypothetical protein
MRSGCAGWWRRRRSFEGGCVFLRPTTGCHRRNKRGHRNEATGRLGWVESELAAFSHELTKAAVRISAQSGRLRSDGLGANPGGKLPSDKHAIASECDPNQVMRGGFDYTGSGLWQICSAACCISSTRLNWFCQIHGGQA